MLLRWLFIIQTSSSGLSLHILICFVQSFNELGETVFLLETLEFSKSMKQE